MTPVFLDTSFAVALILRVDRKHSQAIEFQARSLSVSWRILVSSFVMDEVVTLLNSCGHHAKAVEVGERFLLSKQFEFVFVEPELFNTGWKLFKSRPDKGWSLTDCISFEIMKQRRIAAALTFDKHFAQAGFKMYPEDNR